MREFSPSADGNQVAVARYWFDAEDLRFKLTLVAFDLATGLQRHVRGPWDEEDNLAVLTISPDTQWLAIGTTGGTVRLRDTRTGVERARYFVGRRKIERIVFAPSGNRLAALSRKQGETEGEDQVDVMDMHEIKTLRVFPELGHVENIAVATDGKRIVTAGRVVSKIWEVSTGREIGHVLIMGPSVAISHDGRLLAASSGHTFSFWDLVEEHATEPFEPVTPEWNAWALSPDGSTIATNGGSTVLHYWDIWTHRDRLNEPAAAHQDRAHGLRFTADGKTLFTAGDDKTVRLWEVSSGRQTKVLNLAGKPRILVLSPDEKVLLAAAEDHHWLFVWELATSDKPVILQDGYDTEVFPIAARFTGQGGSISTCWSDGKLRSWDWKDRRKNVVTQPLQIPPMSGDMVNSFEEDRFGAGVFFAAGSKLALIEDQKGLHVADLASGKELYQVPDVAVMAVSPDDRFLAVAKAKHSRGWRSFPRKHEILSPRPSDAILILETQTGKEVRQIPVRPAEIWALRFSPDNKVLAATTGRDRGAIHLYEVASGREIRKVPTPMIGTVALAFTPDGSMLATGMADTSVLLWDLRPSP